MTEKLPEYLRLSLQKQYGEECAEQIALGMAQERRTSLRVNTLKSDAEAVAQALALAGIAFEKVPFSPDAFLLEAGMEKEIWALPMYERGEVYLQSLSSMLPPLALDPKPGTDILDMAAAPGGKTTQMAALTGNKANITACEINQIRAEKMRYNLEKQGCGRVNVMVRDASKMEDFFRFDQILLDAPCSGSGTILLNNPQTCKAFSEKLVKNSARIQLNLLKKALTILKPGQTMVYSTCSILKMENEDIVSQALRGAKAHVEAIDLPGLAALPQLPCAIPGALLVRPDAKYEGFFLCKIRKDK
ncbi:MAG: RsmB/NOP family class I SAM-dependent RNA methyltransferase [Clostridia bacterium]|nr:RsmB/NOP family class I SAM-dependent RNA methyltransferase [Clostridia bacterium]MBR6786873.1 RsmB/NOP family class I SAM-dependent RNA methyltransferase [Clostridia bacterium]